MSQLLLSSPINRRATQFRCIVTGQVHRHGREQQPVIIVDDYLDDPVALIEIAANGPEFAPLGPYYPGIRAPFPHAHLPNLLEPMVPILTEHFHYEAGMKLQECSFSLVTTRPADLMPIPRLPHFDGCEYGRIAALLFLGKATKMVARHFIVNAARALKPSIWGVMNTIPRP